VRCASVELEARVHALTQKMGIGAQFGGKYFCHDVRIVRLPRHGASCPVGIGVSCSADRQALGKIDAEGVWIEELERDPAKYLPELNDSDLGGSTDVVKIDLDKPMDEVRTWSAAPSAARPAAILPPVAPTSRRRDTTVTPLWRRRHTLR
jgi:fumarate hydratase class I